MGRARGALPGHDLPLLARPSSVRGLAGRGPTRARPGPLGVERRLRVGRGALLARARRRRSARRDSRHRDGRGSRAARAGSESLLPGEQSARLARSPPYARVRRRLSAARVPRAGRFLRHDVRDGATGGPFDLVLCRNLVFTYFGDELQREVGRHLASSLRAGGALVVGGHEALPEGLDRLEPWPAARGAYRYRRERRAREPTNGEDRRL